MTERDRLRKCYTCEKCGKDISIRLLSGFSHVTSKHYHSAYQLDEKSMQQVFPY